MLGWAVFVKKPLAFLKLDFLAKSNLAQAVQLGFREPLKKVA
jgi:hypothetical protein